MTALTVEKLGRGHHSPGFMCANRCQPQYGTRVAAVFLSVLTYPFPGKPGASHPGYFCGPCSAVIQREWDRAVAAEWPDLPDGRECLCGCAMPVTGAANWVRGHQGRAYRDSRRDAQEQASAATVRRARAHATNLRRRASQGLLP